MNPPLSGRHNENKTNEKKKKTYHTTLPPHHPRHPYKPSRQDRPGIVDPLAGRHQHAATGPVVGLVEGRAVERCGFEEGGEVRGEVGAALRGGHGVQEVGDQGVVSEGEGDEGDRGGEAVCGVGLVFGLGGK